MRAVGIDISKWDTSFNPSLATGALDFVIQRASYGITRDEKFFEHARGVEKVGIRGTYHYLSSGINWKTQADLFLSVISGSDFHFISCDFEAAFNVPSATFAAMAMEWMKYVKAETKKPVVLYSNLSMYNDWIGRYEAGRAAQYPLWIANYPYFIPDPQKASPSTPRGRKDWLLWQYSPGEKNSFGAQNGVGRRGVDVNVFNGTPDEMRLYFCADNNQTEIEVAELSDLEKLKRLWAAHPELHR